MAFGLTARVKRNFHWDRGSQLQFLVVAAATIEDLNWKLAEVTEDGLVAHTRVSLRSAGEEIRITFSKNIISFKSECIGIQPIAFGKNKSNIRKFYTRFKEMSLLLSENDIVTCYYDLKIKIKKDSKKAQTVVTNSKERLTDFFALFFSNKDFYFTSKILALNVLIYLVMAMTGSFNSLHMYEALYSFGGVHRGLINDGEWWRLITSAFIHIGFLHLFFNMYAFLYASLILEPLLGRFRYLIIYIALAFLSGLSSVYWFPNILSVGASGAIFGLYGLAFALAATGVLRQRIRISLLISIAVFTSYNIGFGIKDGIDYAAHIGGFSWGILIGILITPLYRNFSKQYIKIGSSALLIVLLLSFSTYVFRYIQDNPSIFVKPNPYMAFIADSNLKSSTHFSGEYKSMDKFKDEVNSFWRNYRKTDETKMSLEYDSEILTKKLNAAIYILNKEIKHLYQLTTLNVSPLARDFIDDAASCCDAKCQLYQGYLKSTERPKYNFRKSIRPLIFRAQIASARLNAEQYKEFLDFNY